jgi:AcrR family transcriptional regulator
MNSANELSFAEVKQERAQKTLDDLSAAALDLVEIGDTKLLTSRLLADKAGYGLGTLTKRLTSIDKIFLWAIKKHQKKHLGKLAERIQDFDRTQPVEALIELLVDDAIDKIGKVNPEVIRYYDERIRKYDNRINHHHFPDALLDAFYEAIENDQSNTFRKMTKDELKLILRTTAIFIERPIVESESYAGTKEHRDMALQNLIRLLKK